MLFPGLPDAMFNPAGSSPLQNLASICQVTETHASDSAQVEFSMMDTAAPSTDRVISGTGAITLFPSAQARASFTGPWNENVSPPLTLSGNVTPGSGQLDSQADSSDSPLIPGPGSVFLVLGAAATFAAVRLHDSFRG